MGESSGLFDTPICISYFVTGLHNFGRVETSFLDIVFLGMGKLLSARLKMKAGNFNKLHCTCEVCELLYYGKQDL